MRFHPVENADALTVLIREVGFLPFFAGEIKGLSVEECCPPTLWFSDTEDGPWEWKGPVIRTGHCVYGKFFAGKAGFVSLDWLPDFANYRRDGYDFDARFDDELASFRDKAVFDVLAEHGSLLSKELKARCHYRKGENKGFETVITHLQMQTYVTVSDFEYAVNRRGEPYGWGIARYSTPEALFGYDAVTAAYRRPPAESAARIAAHLARLLPRESENAILRLIG